MPSSQAARLSADFMVGKKMLGGAYITGLEQVALRVGRSSSEVSLLA
jgi:hypothetical protein